jgi:hypothetical protein
VGPGGASQARPSQGRPLALTHRGAGRCAPATRPARERARHDIVAADKGRCSRGANGAGQRAHEGRGATGKLTRSTDGRSEAASGEERRWRRTGIVEEAPAGRGRGR